MRRKIKESPWAQGRDERIAYLINTAPWGGGPTNPQVILLGPEGEDVSETNLNGTTMVAGDVITTPLVVGLVPGRKYRLKVRWERAGNTLEAWGEILGEE